MARILTEPFRRALIIESPHPTLDGHLGRAGISATRLDKVPDEQSLIDALHQTRAQVLFKRSQVRITRNILEKCPDLHLIQLCCIGDDSIDLGAAADLGVIVANDPISNGRSVVELAVGHLVGLSRRLYETDVAMHQNQWDKSDKGRFEILGKRLGIVGLGNIGRQVARVAQALGMTVGFHDNRPVAREVGVEMGWEPFDNLVELFKKSDCVSVHTSSKDAWGRDNAGLLDEALPHLGADRGEGSPRIFLNLARGNVHGSEVLRKAVQDGYVRRAAVDVYPDEPSPGQRDWENPYVDEPRITCTPHIGAATQEAQPRIAQRVATTVDQFSRLGWLRDCVFAPKVELQLGNDGQGKALLCVVHSVSRGTKKAIDDAIYQAEVSNLGSVHRDFDIGLAYDLSLLDRPLSDDQLQGLVNHAASVSKDPSAIRAVRQIRT